MNIILHKQNMENLKSIIRTISYNEYQVAIYKAEFNKILRTGRDVVVDYMDGRYDEYRGLLFWMAFHQPITDNLFEILKYTLTKSRFDINYKYKKNNSTILHLLCHNSKLYNYLIENGADPYINDEYNNTLLHILSKDDYRIIETTTTILQNTILQINDKNDYGEEPIHIASKYNFPLLLEFYKNNPTFFINNINNRDDKGNTPLHWAVKSHNLFACIFLMLLNADLTIKNNEDDTPYRIALNTYECDVIEYWDCIKVVDYLNLIKLKYSDDLRNFDIWNIKTCDLCNIKICNILQKYIYNTNQNIYELITELNVIDNIYKLDCGIERVSR